MLPNQENCGGLKTPFVFAEFLFLVRKPRVVFVGVYHTSASDHLPLVVDLEL